ncbi:sugar phosphate isomerase/epimerase family protein [Blastopirellula marina]|uniref:Xylose isomerase n=1 Tax=Blastopirellula marina TaxID=124 RepID=A0A2S8GH30_9BACT|nr:sugar phosphate isomerase/epimerase family protein [Blastopirellula marina]PQO40089.1 xylose isomerase [Blastopirellula marina]PQO43620.1 xylose isomerase [Blastopirellula marina]PTL45464.1 sugar phosphate isomerase/epimerase [Blastopirellula marina]
MSEMFDRRDALRFAGLAGAGFWLGTSAAAAAETPAADDHGIRYCLNMSTIRGQNLPLDQEIEIAAKAGYGGIEPWINKIAAYKEAGGSLDDLRKRIADHGMQVESAIGFAQWIVNDEAARKKGLEDAKRDMLLVKAIGGTRIAAPPAGATNGGKLDLLTVADRYRALCEVGDEVGVTPELELWGFSENLSRLGEVACVATEAAHPRSCIMPDVYHIYKGGSDFAGLRFINGAAIPVFHMNDYPADPPRATINDSARVFPGDGVAPLTQIIRDLHESGFRGAFSLELFNPGYWKRDALEVAKEGLTKMKASVDKALG